MFWAIWLERIDGELEKSAFFFGQKYNEKREKTERGFSDFFPSLKKLKTRSMKRYLLVLIF